MMMREQQWDRSNCRHFRIDVCLHQRIYMRVNARNEQRYETGKWFTQSIDMTSAHELCKGGRV